MIYFGNPTTQAVRDVMVAESWLGAITTPDQRNAIPPGVPWIADNGLGPGAGGGAGKGARTDQEWWEWLSSRPWDPALCYLAVAPDVVGSHDRTLARSRPWLERIRGLGYPAAFVAQDGMEWSTWDPWDEIDALFVGGSTAWKLSEHAVELMRVASSVGKHVHVGRVNSLRRIVWARQAGADSVDGTFLAYGPDVNLPKLRRYVVDAVAQDALSTDGQWVPAFAAPRSPVPVTPSDLDAVVEDDTQPDLLSLLE